MTFDELRDVESCFPQLLVIINICLACVDGIIAFIAFCQLLRIHSRNSQVGWTRQKFKNIKLLSSKMIIDDEVIGYLVYFVITVLANCKGWVCWSNSCGFFFMAFPDILFLAAFLLLLSFWVDVCHQAKDDEEDEECSSQEALLQKTWSKPSSSSTDGHLRCFPCRQIHLGSRQKIVVLVTIVVFVIMVVSAVLIWIGMGKNFVDSEVVARVYVDLFAIALLLLGGALGCYGLILFLKMSKVRSERASSEMWKVAGLAAVSVLCFTLNSLVALLTDIPMLYHWDPYQIDGVYAAVLLILYYFIGSSIPSASLLWVMRELPPVAANTQEDVRTITFFASSAVTGAHPQHWTVATSSQNQLMLLKTVMVIVDNNGK
ncbi:THH1/TOM1/TOM3 domain [Dillenia turbinata]|uniref:THH1/TOM1/TOM3 domain n=1 Tax=Dillenia turbinata TaxID=194707 RepID=A0AAN8ZEX5_9MAGN